VRHTASANQIYEKIERVCRANIDGETLRYEVIRFLRHAIPFDAWCWALVDPDTLIPFEGFAEGPFQARDQIHIFQLDYQGKEAASIFLLSQGREYLSSLSRRTGGDFSQSRLWEEVYRPNGLGDEMRMALTIDDTCWGTLLLYRARSARWFSNEEAALMRRLARPLATRLRQTLVSPSRISLRPSTGPGVVILDPDLLPVTMTPLAQHWLAQVCPGWLQDQRLLPTTVSALVARLEAREQTPLPDRWAPRVRVRSLTGDWFVLQVERLTTAPAPGTIALTIQPALPSQMLPLFLQIFALTRRERELTSFVLQGLSTTEIAAELHISSYTVQEHLKAIFTKVGVGSRRELVARLHLS
jgi:DNA-binding CsgD family transcriptional regulator